MNAIEISNAIESIKLNGLYLAGQHLHEGAVGIVQDKDGVSTLVFLDMTKNAPLRAIVERAEGGWRVASPHLTPEFVVVGAGFEVALMNFYQATGYLITSFDSFNVNPVDVFFAQTSIPQKERLMKASNQAVADAVLAAKGLIIDGHGNGVGTVQLTHIALFGEPGVREEVVAVFEDEAFSLNAVFLSSEGKPTLSRWATGGCVNSRKETLEASLANYKDLSGNKIWAVVRVDGWVAEEDFATAVEANPYPVPDRSDWKPINPKIQVSNYNTIEAVKAAGGNIRDTHQFEKMIQVSHVALFGVPGYKEKVVCLLEGKLFCLNPIFLDHGEPYLCTNSVGGNLMHKELPMEERLATYQDWDHNMLWNLVRVDGK